MTLRCSEWLLGPLVSHSGKPPGAYTPPAGLGLKRRSVFYIETLSFDIVCRYEHANDDKSSLKLDPEGEKIHAGLLKKLNELESDLTFKMGNYYFSKSTMNFRRPFSNWFKDSGLYVLGRNAGLVLSRMSYLPSPPQPL